MNSISKGTGAGHQRTALCRDQWVIQCVFYTALEGSAEKNQLWRRDGNQTLESQYKGLPTFHPARVPIEVTGRKQTWWDGCLRTLSCCALRWMGTELRKGGLLDSFGIPALIVSSGTEGRDPRGCPILQLPLQCSKICEHPRGRSQAATSWWLGLVKADAQVGHGLWG